MAGAKARLNAAADGSGPLAGLLSHPHQNRLLVAGRRKRMAVGN